MMEGWQYRPTWQDHVCTVLKGIVIAAFLALNLYILITNPGFFIEADPTGWDWYVR